MSKGSGEARAQVRNELLACSLIPKSGSHSRSETVTFRYVAVGSLRVFLMLTVTVVYGPYL